MPNGTVRRLLVTALLGCGFAFANESLSAQDAAALAERVRNIVSNCPSGEIRWSRTSWMDLNPAVMEKNVDVLLQTELRESSEVLSDSEKQERRKRIAEDLRAHFPTETTWTGRALLKGDEYLEEITHPDGTMETALWRDGKGTLLESRHATVKVNNNPNCPLKPGSATIAYQANVTPYPPTSGTTHNPFHMLALVPGKGPGLRLAAEKLDSGESELVFEDKDGVPVCRALLSPEKSLPVHLEKLHSDGKVAWRADVQWREEKGAWIPASFTLEGWTPEGVMVSRDKVEVVQFIPREVESELTIEFPWGTLVRDETVSPPSTYQVGAPPRPPSPAAE